MIPFLSACFFAALFIATDEPLCFVIALLCWAFQVLREAKYFR